MIEVASPVNNCHLRIIIIILAERTHIHTEEKSIIFRDTNKCLSTSSQVSSVLGHKYLRAVEFEILA